jgi:hypothetical protein
VKIMTRISQVFAILICAAGLVLAQNTGNSGSSTDSPKDQNPSSQKSNPTSLENEKPKPDKKTKVKKPKNHNSDQTAAPKGNATTKDDTDKGTTGPQDSDQTVPSQNPPPTPPKK